MREINEENPIPPKFYIMVLSHSPPPLILLQYEYLDIVLNATQKDLLVNLF